MLRLRRVRHAAEMKHHASGLIRLILTICSHRTEWGCCVTMFGILELHLPDERGTMGNAREGFAHICYEMLKPQQGLKYRICNRFDEGGSIYLTR